MKFQTFKQNILKPLLVYVIGLLTVFICIWLLLGIALTRLSRRDLIILGIGAFAVAALPLSLRRRPTSRSATTTSPRTR